MLSVYADERGFIVSGDSREKELEERDALHVPRGKYELDDVVVLLKYNDTFDGDATASRGGCQVCAGTENGSRSKRSAALSSQH